jgi:hypothetical protein
MYEYSRMCRDFNEYSQTPHASEQDYWGLGEYLQLSAVDTSSRYPDTLYTDR